LSKLEDLGSPPGSAISKTKICKVLKYIKKLEEIPRDDELLITKRAENLFDKWKPILDAQPKVIKAPQPEVIDLTEEPEVAELIEEQQPEVTDAMEESCQPGGLLPHPNEDQRNEPSAFREGVTAVSPRDICKHPFYFTQPDLTYKQTTVKGLGTPPLAIIRLQSGIRHLAH
jgi:hypothetical protein